MRNTFLFPKSMARSIGVPMLALAILSIAVFGFLGADCEKGLGQNCCIAKVVRGMNCPHANPVAHIDFHFSVLKSFSKATVDNGAVTASALGALFLALIFAFGSSLRLDPATASALFAQELNTPRALPLRRALLRWLAIREKQNPAYSD